MAVTLSVPGPPMTLGNMRSLGVRSLAVMCELCHHKATAQLFNLAHGDELTCDGTAVAVPKG